MIHKRSTLKDTVPAILVNSTIALVPVLCGQLVYSSFGGIHTANPWKSVAAFLLLNIVLAILWQNTKPYRFKHAALLFILILEWSSVVASSAALYFDTTQSQLAYLIVGAGLVWASSQWFQSKLSKLKDLSANVFALLGVISSAIWGMSAFNQTAVATPKTSDQLYQPTERHENSNIDPSSWNYDKEFGPSHWSKLSVDFQACEQGTLQSPIDIPKRAALISSAYRFNYASESASITSIVGNSLKFTFNGQSKITNSDQEYLLKEIDVHSPSEHSISGLLYPLEFQFIHKDKLGKPVHFALFAEKGRENPLFNDALKAIPAGSKEVSIDLQKIIPKDLKVWSYSGSMTTPPCTEGVAWSVFYSTIELSESQIAVLRSIIRRNSRPVQPLNGRPLNDNI